MIQSITHTPCGHYNDDNTRAGDFDNNKTIIALVTTRSNRTTTGNCTNTQDVTDEWFHIHIYGGATILL